MIYIFDMDGTLIDSMPTFGGAIMKFLDEQGVFYPDDLIRTVTPLGFAGTVKYLKDSFALDLSRSASYSSSVAGVKLGSKPLGVTTSTALPRN